MLDFQKLSANYQQALLRQAVPFWLKYSRDNQCGGYFDLLSTTGSVIEGDKSVALQAQQTWAFSWLYNTLDGQPAWLDHARHGASFLSRFAHNETLTCYAQLDRRGRPVAPASNLAADAFTVMAYAQLYSATSEDEWALLARQTFAALLDQRSFIRAEQAQRIGGFRQLRHLSEPVALLKATLDMQPLLNEETWKETLDTVLHELLNEFLDRRTDVLREYVLPEGGFVNTPEGRRLHVGLTFQAAGYVLDTFTQSGAVSAGNRLGDHRKLALQVVNWCLRLCEQAWDELAGGLNLFMDVKNQPSIFSTRGQKWAWVHLEAVSALTKGYFYTRHPDCPKWFKRIHDYTFQHFPDLKNAGWNLAIDQHNQPLLLSKATLDVGCFSLIKCLAETAQTLTKCGQIQPMGRSIRV